MNDASREELVHGVDRLVLKGRRLFGWGWVAHSSQAIRSLALEVKGEGWARQLPVRAGLGRTDVAEAFPHLLHGASSGFVVTGYLPEAPPAALWLEIELDDGTRRRIEVTGAAEHHYEHRRAWRTLAWMAKAVWRRLKRGDLRGIARRARAQNFDAPSLDGVDPSDVVARLLGPHVVLFFDHNMGGGANQYRRERIAELLQAGQDVLLCTYNLPTLDYRLEVLKGGSESRIFRIPSFVLLERILERVPVAEIFLNSPVSFDEPLLLAEWLASIRDAHPRVRLTVAVHDYFCVCPSFVLLNADGRYCGIPDVAECSACLARHKASYVALSPPTEIGPWRALWGRCLHAADEVRCFSESTRRHIVRAYPTLDRERLRVVPHRVDLEAPRLPRLDHGAPLAVGILGHISVQKGAALVADMMSLVERRGDDVRVVVLGTLDCPHRSSRLKVTGEYRRAEVVDLIEAHRINLFLFPSVCPETFSYVVEELMTLRVPVVAFDLGAPGERLRHYDQARLCAEVSPEAALAALLDFHEALAARSVPGEGAPGRVRDVA